MEHMEITMNERELAVFGSNEEQTFDEETAYRILEKTYRPTLDAVYTAKGGSFFDISKQSANQLARHEAFRSLLGDIRNLNPLSDDDWTQLHLIWREMQTKYAQDKGVKQACGDYEREFWHDYMAKAARAARKAVCVSLWNKEWTPAVNDLLVKIAKAKRFETTVLADFEIQPWCQEYMAQEAVNRPAFFLTCPDRKNLARAAYEWLTDHDFNRLMYLFYSEQGFWTRTCLSTMNECLWFESRQWNQLWFCLKFKLAARWDGSKAHLGSTKRFLTYYIKQARTVEDLDSKFSGFYDVARPKKEEVLSEVSDADFLEIVKQSLTPEKEKGLLCDESLVEHLSPKQIQCLRDDTRSLYLAKKAELIEKAPEYVPGPREMKSFELNPDGSIHFLAHTDYVKDVFKQAAKKMKRARR